MRLLLALLLPGISFFFIGRPWAGIICWIPAAIWAVYALSEYNTDRKMRLAGWHPPY
jgi:hypothetical protein